MPYWYSTRAIKKSLRGERLRNSSMHQLLIHMHVRLRTLQVLLAQGPLHELQVTSRPPERRAERATTTMRVQPVQLPRLLPTPSLVAHRVHLPQPRLEQGPAEVVPQPILTHMQSVLHRVLAVQEVPLVVQDRLVVQVHPVPQELKEPIVEREEVLGVALLRLDEHGPVEEVHVLQLELHDLSNAQPQAVHELERQTSLVTFDKTQELLPFLSREGSIDEPCLRPAMVPRVPLPELPAARRDERLELADLEALAEGYRFLVESAVICA